MARYGGLLADAQWEAIRSLLPKRRKRPHGGRPPADDRKVLEGILWSLGSGAPWCDLPVEFPSPSTCWRRLRDWEEQEVCLAIWRTFLSELNERQQLKWSESLMGGSFAPAKKGAAGSEKPSKGKGTKWMVVVDGQGVPLGDYLQSASRAEVQLVEKTLAAIRVRRRHHGGRDRIERMIMDRGYDSDGLRRHIRRRGIEPIVPHRKGRRKPSMQDG